MELAEIGQAVAPMRGRGWRIVESQREAATLSITSSMENQVVLEELLESHSKPDYLAGSEHLHYLLKTPFRYPPLKWGSRFGRRTEPGIFYGSREIPTAVAECAYYRFVFLAGLSKTPPNRITTKHTVFSFQYQTQTGISLLLQPFLNMPDLRSPSDYTDTQALGLQAREIGIHVIEYHSVRATQTGVNCAVIHPDAFSSLKPSEAIDNVLCLLTGEQCGFKLGREVYSFGRDDFLVRGRFPIVG